MVLCAHFGALERFRSECLHLGRASVVSHPLCKERTKDGAPEVVLTVSECLHLGRASVVSHPLCKERTKDGAPEVVLTVSFKMLYFISRDFSFWQMPNPFVPQDFSSK